MTMSLMSKKRGAAKSVVRANKPALAVKEKPALAVKGPPSSFSHSVDKLLDTMTLIPWDPFRGFEWAIEYELPSRVRWVDVIYSDYEYVVRAECPVLKKDSLNLLS